MVTVRESERRPPDVESEGNAEPATHPVHSGVASAARPRPRARAHAGSAAHGAIKGSMNRERGSAASSSLPSLIIATMMNQAVRGRGACELLLGVDFSQRRCRVALIKRDAAKSGVRARARALIECG